MQKHRAFVALGSNLQNPELQVGNAINELNELPQTTLIKASSLYKTSPVGYDNQPDFINAVAEVETALNAPELLDALLALENSHGRERPFPNAPRVLDLDLLLFDDVSMQTSILTLPHPRMHLRGFVMQPLVEIAPDVIIPNIGKVSDIAVSYAGQSVEIVNPDKKKA
ncbi:2-amino-4-hydroxy-6-hydroxymethyldihydropteridine diphosphokinase [Methyloradius palustris]|nr:2-amino-4-hydroxy-6-hydroxymethyldihydropteridine diphosphokinase [Methyloradius palustris]